MDVDAPQYKDCGMRPIWIANGISCIGFFNASIESLILTIFFFLKGFILIPMAVDKMMNKNQKRSTKREGFLKKIWGCISYCAQKISTKILSLTLYLNIFNTIRLKVLIGHWVTFRTIGTYSHLIGVWLIFCFIFFLNALIITVLPFCFYFEFLSEN